MEGTLQQNRFLLVNVAAQRARQLMQGADPLIRTKSRKAAAVAVKEVNRDLVQHFYPEDIAGILQGEDEVDEQAQEE
jgi:DNA-directed RNA polymerase omega subunit